MEEPEYRVYVRIPVPRPSGFIDPPSFIWNTEKEATLWKVISRRTRGDINWTELAGVFQVDVPFLLQQAQFLYEKQLEDLQLQMQRVNSSTSVLGGSKDQSDSQRASAQLDVPMIPRQVSATTPTRPSPSPLGPSHVSPPRGSAPSSPTHVQSSFRHRKSSTSSPLVPTELPRSTTSTTTSSSSKSNSSAAALRLYQQLHHQLPVPAPTEEHGEPADQEPEDEEEEPAFLPLTRPTTANKPSSLSSPPGKEESNPGSDSFSDLSDASVSKSALEEALEEHLRRGGSVAGSTMQGGGVRSIWKGKFNT